MSIGQRSVAKIVGALFMKRHYKALFMSFGIYDRPLYALRDYFFATGQYPKMVGLKTNGFHLSPTIFSHHDLLTINEIFCREDYISDHTIEAVIDVGSNIGLSAMYFLTRNLRCRTYLYEPDPSNVKKLKINLKDFKDRYTLHEKAVSDAGGIVNFGIEDSGRYGGINLQLDGGTIVVECNPINNVLEDVLRIEKRINILKLDTEGAELKTINAIAKHYFDFIDVIYFEQEDTKHTPSLNTALLHRYRLSNKGPMYKLERKDG